VTSVPVASICKDSRLHLVGGNRLVRIIKDVSSDALMKTEINGQRGSICARKIDIAVGDSIRPRAPSAKYLLSRCIDKIELFQRIDGCPSEDCHNIF
jgi:hypothetical protein